MEFGAVSGDDSMPAGTLDALLGHWTDWLFAILPRILLLCWG